MEKWRLKGTVEGGMWKMEGRRRKVEVEEGWRVEVEVEEGWRVGS